MHDARSFITVLFLQRGSAVAVEVGGKIHVIGGATTVEGSKDPFFTFFGPARVLSTNDVYDPATNTWQSRRPMAVPTIEGFGSAGNSKMRHVDFNESR
jgi:hypothetical protein